MKIKYEIIDNAIRELIQQLIYNGYTLEHDISLFNAIQRLNRVLVERISAQILEDSIAEIDYNDKAIYSKKYAKGYRRMK